MFTTENTTGFSQEELDLMNDELANRMRSGEFADFPDCEREQWISEEILGMV